jgi:hypothetical protein
VEGLFAYPCRRVATPAYPLGAKIRKNRPRCSPRGGFLCSFNTITPKSPHSKPFPIPFASVLGGVNPTTLTPSDDMNNVIRNGFYDIRNAQRPAHCPGWGGLNSLIYVHTFNQDTRVAQFLYEANTSDFGFRSWYIGESVPEWVMVSKA